MDYSSERAVAIVGIGAVMPDALNAAAFWQNILNKKYSIIDVPPERWSPVDYYNPDIKAPDKTYSKIGSWVRGFQFDWQRYRIPPKVVASMDQGQQWAVTIAAEALADYGYPERPLDTERTGVILGTAMGGELHYITHLRIMFPEYQRALEKVASFNQLPANIREDILQRWHEAFAQNAPEITEDSMPGELPNVMSGRVANLLNLRGANFITDAACASSFAAVNAAVEMLTEHHVDAVISGGVDRNMGASTFVKFCKIGALSATGSRPFGDGADGFVMGEGSAAFLLKRLEDAERAGDKIYAVIRGAGGSSDGKGKGITAPNPVGQRLAIERAWENAGLDPATATLIEAHGTSTRVGDVVEVESLTSVFKGASPKSIGLGSVKSNVGHLKAGAGAAGLFKAAMAVYHKILPPTLNAETPNPNIDFNSSPFYLLHEPREWQKPNGTPRRCGVSAYGFGGTNFHLVLEEHIPGMLTQKKRTYEGVTLAENTTPMTSSSISTPPASASGGESFKMPSPVRGILAIGANTPTELKEKLDSLVSRVENGWTPPIAPPKLSDLQSKERLVIDFGNHDELLDRMHKAQKAMGFDTLQAWTAFQAQGIFRGSGPKPGKLAFLFPGQGSQYLNMGRELSAIAPIVAEVWRDADRVMTPILGRPLTDFVFVEKADGAAEIKLMQTEITQPAMLTMDIAIYRLLESYGFKPNMVMGHSLGEYAALIVSGIMPFEDALTAAAARGGEMAKVEVDDKGWMGAVMAPLEVVEAVLKEVDGYVVPANINSNSQCVIGGSSKAVEKALQLFTERGYQAMQIPVSHAFHTQIVAPAGIPLRKTLDKLRISTPKLPLVANVTGEFYPQTVEEIKDILQKQIASPVQWVKSMQTMYDAGVRTFVESGPKRALRGFVGDVFGDKVLALLTCHPKNGELPSFNQALCGLYAAGYYEPPAVSVPTPVEVRAETRVQPAPVVAAAPGVADSSAASMNALSQILAQAIQQAAGYATQPGLARPYDRNDVPGGSLVITGTGLGLPGQEKPIMDPDNALRILRGEQFVDLIPERFRNRMLAKRVTRLVKSEDGSGHFETITDSDEVIRLAGRPGPFDLSEEYGVSEKLVEALDITTQLAMAAGLDALREAGIPLVQTYRMTSTGKYLPDRWMLPEALRDETGVIFASAFPGGDRFADEFKRYYAYQNRLEQLTMLEDLRRHTGDSQTLNEINRRANEIREQLEREPYEFDRRFLFRVLSMGHSQFAEYIGVRGPNTQVNAACASTAQAIAIGEDWIRSGRCRRVLVLGADNVTSENLLEWIGAGFLASGAAATDDRVDEAALPFDRRRHGTLLGMGACAVVLESEDAVRERGMRGIVELLSSETKNSAFHGTRLDVDHISMVMNDLVTAAERRFGVNRYNMASQLVFMSHETFTPARGGSASAEVIALRHTFGEAAKDIVVANTKGFTGHPMGVGIEDVIAIKILEYGLVPPVPNHKEVDPDLGELNLSRGGRYPVQYAIHLAAGFGSQISMTLTRRIPGALDRIDNKPQYQRWLSDVSGYDHAEVEVEKRVLRIKAQGSPNRPPLGSQWRYGTGPLVRTISAGDGAAMPSTLPVAYTVPPVVAPPKPVEVKEVAKAAPPPVATPVMKETPKPAPEPVKVVSAPVVEKAPVQSSTVDAVTAQVIKLVAAQTGYPEDMLDLDLDLEADLGIDTVKQAETFAAIREAFAIPRRDDLKLRDYATMRRVVDFVRENRPDLAVNTPVAAPVAIPSAPVVIATPKTNGVVHQVLEIVAAQTGYPIDMLDLELDLEADLGIDTVKQAETFAAIREAFSIPRRDDVKLRDYATLKQVIEFVQENRPDLVVSAAPATPVVTPVTMPAAPVVATPKTDGVVHQVLEIVAAQTGYPMEMLELDLDLEADLGIDTVKQAETFAAIRAAFDIPRRDDLKLRDYPTLKRVIEFVQENRPDLVVSAPAPVMAAVAMPLIMAAPSVVISTPSPTADPVVEQVLQIVAAQTGYPLEMLELDLDLEADLGIDTVKQAETFAAIRGAFDIPRRDDLKLRDYPTLARVIEFVRESRPDLAPVTGVAPPTAPSAPMVITPASDGDPVVAKVLEIVSNQTGYPREMLELDLDLEADLGIDTVKQAETFAAIRAAFDIPRRDDLKLRDYPTLARVIEFVRESRPDLALTASAPAVTTASVSAATSAAPKSSLLTGTLEDADRIPRRVPTPSLRPAFDLCKPTGVKLDSESRVVVMVDGGGVGKALVDRLQKRGVQTLVIEEPLQNEALETQLKGWLAEGTIQGVYWLPALDVEPALEDMDLAQWRELNRVRVKNFYTAMRTLYDAINTGGTFLVTATRLGGLHGYGDDGASAALGGAVTGFAKAYKRERGDVLVKAVDFENSRKTAALADILIAETLNDPGVVEVGHYQEERYTITLVEKAAADGQAGLTLGKETVFVVTGAAGGITSAIVADLAAASGGVFFLLDLVKAPDAHDENVRLFRSDKEALKRALIEKAKAAGERPTPVQIDKQVMQIERDEAALRAVEAVQEAGGVAHYRSANLLEGDAVAAVIGEIREKFGRIDVLIHAGGLEISRALSDKDFAQFSLVFDVKADGFFNILKAAKDMPIGASIVFSSVAGRFGNNGQTDYSAANDLLCKISSSFRKWRPATRGIAIDWTAWGGIGMATRGSIPKIMEMAGIDMLPPESGIPTVRRELVAGGFKGEIVVGNRLGILMSEYDESGGLDIEKAGSWLAGQMPNALMVGTVKSAKLYGGVEVETPLDPKAQPFLYDHQIDGTPVLPGVMGIESFAEMAARFNPGWHIAAVGNVQFQSPFKFYRMEAQTLYLSAFTRPTADGARLVEATLKSVRDLAKPGRSVQEKVHFTGEVLLRAEAIAKPTVEFTPPTNDSLSITHDAIYKVYFHGPAYQVLERAEVSGTTAIGLMADNLPPNSAPADGLNLMEPRLIELCFQTAGLWEMRTKGVMALPMAVESVTAYQPASAAKGKRLYALVEAIADGASFKVRVVDTSGDLYVELIGYRTVQLPGTVTL